MIMSDVDYIYIFQIMSYILNMFCGQILMMTILYIYINDVNGNINDGNSIINDGNGYDNANGAVFKV